MPAGENARPCSNPDRTFLIGGNRVASVAYTNVEASREPWHGRVTFGMRNALGRNPPIACSASFFFPELRPARPLPLRPLPQRF
jgi:hypothetical protein